MLLLQGVILSIVVIIGKTPYFRDMKKFAIKKGCLMREARRGNFPNLTTYCKKRICTCVDYHVNSVVLFVRFCLTLVSWICQRPLLSGKDY